MECHVPCPLIRSRLLKAETKSSLAIISRLLRPNVQNAFSYLCSQYDSHTALRTAFILQDLPPHTLRLPLLVRYSFKQ